MSKPSLEKLLRDRLADPRLMIASLSEREKSMILTFGEIGDAPRLDIEINGNSVRVLGQSVRTTVTAAPETTDAETEE